MFCTVGDPWNRDFTSHLEATLMHIKKLVSVVLGFNSGEISISPILGWGEEFMKETHRGCGYRDHYPGFD